MGFKETVMEFAGKVGDTVDKGIKSGSEGLQKMTEKSRLQKEINQRNIEINNIFQAVGQKLYKEDPNNKMFEGVFGAVKEKEAQIEEFKKQLAVLEDKTPCRTCGEMISKEASVCPKCGNITVAGQKNAASGLNETKQPEKVEAEKVKTCKNCGNTLDDTARFCNKCGSKLDD